MIVQAATRDAVALRRSAIRIVNTLFCLPNLYHRADFLPVSAAAAPALKTYNDMPDRLSRILLEALRVEADPENQQMLLSSLFIHAMEHLNYSLAMPHSLIQLVLEKLSGWPNDTMHCALHLLGCMARTYHLYQKDSLENEIAATVVSELCKFVERYHSMSAKRLEEEIACEAILCTSHVSGSLEHSVLTFMCA